MKAYMCGESWIENCDFWFTFNEERANKWMEEYPKERWVDVIEIQDEPSKKEPYWEHKF